MTLVYLPLDRLSVSKTNMRYAKKAPDVSDILPTIRRRGVIQTLLVRPCTAPEGSDGDHYEIVAGARRFAGEVAGEFGKPFVETRSGERIEGVLKRRLDLVSGRFALVEKSREFTLVPWKPALERQLGSPVSGLMRGDGVNWSLGRGRGGPVIS